jgi:hypothetical protein
MASVAEAAARAARAGTLGDRDDAPARTAKAKAVRYKEFSDSGEWLRCMVQGSAWRKGGGTRSSQTLVSEVQCSARLYGTRGAVQG